MVARIGARSLPHLWWTRVRNVGIASAPWGRAGADRTHGPRCLDQRHLGGNERDLDPLDRPRRIGGVRLSWKGLLGISDRRDGTGPAILRQSHGPLSQPL